MICLLKKSEKLLNFWILEHQMVLFMASALQLWPYFLLLLSLQIPIRNLRKRCYKRWWSKWKEFLDCSLLQKQLNGSIFLRLKKKRSWNFSWLKSKQQNYYKIITSWLLKQFISVFLTTSCYPCSIWSYKLFCLFVSELNL